MRRFSLAKWMFITGALLCTGLTVRADEINNFRSGGETSRFSGNRAEPASGLVGTWKNIWVDDKGVERFKQLALSGDGTFQFSFGSRDRIDQTFRGRYQYSGRTLELTAEDGEKVTMEVTSVSGNLLNTRYKGAPLTFERQNGVAGTWKMTDSITGEYILIVLNGDGAFRVVLGKGTKIDNEYVGRYQYASGSLELTGANGNVLRYKVVSLSENQLTLDVNGKNGTFERQGAVAQTGGRKAETYVPANAGVSGTWKMTATLENGKERIMYLELSNNGSFRLEFRSDGRSEGTSKGRYRYANGTLELSFENGNKAELVVKRLDLSEMTIVINGNTATMERQAS